VGLELAKAYVTARGDVSQVAGDFHAGRGQVEQAAKSLQLSVNRILGMIGIGVSIGAIISEMRQGIVLAERQIDAEARIAAVVKGTGMAAGFTADQLKAMASQMQRITTVGDEEILESMGILLTFKKVQRDVFTSAIDTILDMSAVMGTNARGAAMQLGRALEDPIYGMTALRRTGVSFSEEQKDHIKQLQETNRLAEAQALILDIVRGQLGDVAEAMAQTDSGKLKQARNVLGDLREELGKKMIPLQMKFVEMQQKWIGLLMKAIEVVTSIGSRVREWLSTPFGVYLTNMAKTVFLGGLVLAGTWALVWAAGAMAGAFTVAWTSALGPIALLIPAMALVGVAIVELWGKGDTFGEKMKDVFENKIPDAIDATAFAVRNFSMIMELVAVRWSIKLLELFGGLYEKFWEIVPVFAGVCAGMRAAFGAVIDWMANKVLSLKNIMAAVGAGIQAMFVAVLSGNLRGAAVEFGKAFDAAMAKVGAPPKVDIAARLRTAFKITEDIVKAMIVELGMDDAQKMLDILRAREQALLEAIARMELERKKKKEDEDKEDKKKPSPEKVAEAVAEAERSMAGRYGFLEYSRALQDMLLTRDDSAKKTAENTKKANEQLEDANAKLAKLIEVGKGPSVFV